MPNQEDMRKILENIQYVLDGDETEEALRNLRGYVERKLEAFPAQREEEGPGPEGLLPPGDYSVKIAGFTSAGTALLEIIDPSPYEGRKLFASARQLYLLAFKAKVRTTPGLEDTVQNVVVELTHRGT